MDIGLSEILWIAMIVVGLIVLFLLFYLPFFIVKRFGLVRAVSMKRGLFGKERDEDPKVPLDQLLRKMKEEDEDDETGETRSTR